MKVHYSHALLPFLCVFCLCSYLPTHATADLIGDSVNASATGDFSVSPATATVDTPGDGMGGPGEFGVLDVGTGSFVNVDIEANSITILDGFGFGAALGTGTLTFSDLTWVDFPSGTIIGVTGPTLSGVTVNGSLTATNGPNSVTITVDDVVFDAGGSATFDLQVDHGATPIPEPASYLLWAMVGSALASCRWHRRLLPRNVA